MTRFLAWAIALNSIVYSATLAADPPRPEALVRNIDGGVNANGLQFHKAEAFVVEGRGWSDGERHFDRLPLKAKSMVRPRIWDLAGNTAGVCIRFVTDATEVHARWTVTSEELGMNHMPAAGVSGVDLYVKDSDAWRRLGTGVPEGKANLAQLASGLLAQRREYLLYLPLYNGIASLEIGVPSNAAIEPADRRPPDRAKPIVFYGTSITQGGCASRPGMCHVAILGRRFDRPVINLGFTSNGTMDPEMAVLLGEIDAAAYVIDCVPNMNTDMVAQRAVPFVEQLHLLRPQTPILLVEDRTFADAILSPVRQAEHAALRQALRSAYNELQARGDIRLEYVEGDGLLDQAGEGSVDGSHPTDLGFMHIADRLEAPIARMLSPQQ